MTECYFFDSYALIENSKGSESYKRFNDALILTTKLNIFEGYYILLRDAGQVAAQKFLDLYYENVVDFDSNIIEAAVAFRLAEKPKFSMTDCIGYKIAEFLEIRLLTGDDGFEGFPNVEFVK